MSPSFLKPKLLRISLSKLFLISLLNLYLLEPNGGLVARILNLFFNLFTDSEVSESSTLKKFG